MKEKRKSKAGRNPKLDPAVYRKALALAGDGLSLRSRKAFQNCGAVNRSGGLCRQSAKSKVI
ncbi:hypothetical protein E7X23_26125 [Bacteroides fragilis]|nr:hypothetical protein E7X23_26125 [Bacteroides fragilis]